MKAETQKHPVNSQINASIVRLIGEKGEQVGVVSMEEALKSATEAGLDLVQVADSNPVVCRLMDYSKHLFELKKRRSASRKKQKRIQVKEIKFRPGTEKADYDVKLRNLTRFLEGGDKAKVTIRFRGREMAHPELGAGLLQRVQDDLKDYGSVEQEPKQEGRQLAMVLSPHGKKRARSTEAASAEEEEGAATAQLESGGEE